MIRDYNGNVNHKVLRELERLCDVNSRNRKNLMDEFTAKGEVAFYENNDPLAGGRDEFSKIESLKSEKEITEFLKKDFEERLIGYLKWRNTKDCLLSTLIEFIKKSNGVFPNKEEMRQIKKEAEAKRLAALPTDKIPTKRDEFELVKLEILQLCEEIMESRRKSKPEDIFTPVEPYSERLVIIFGEFAGAILHDIYYGNGDYRDYSLVLRENRHLTTKIFYDSDGNPVVEARDFEREEFDNISTIGYLEIIHKHIVEIARNEGIEFESEI